MLFPVDRHAQDFIAIVQNVVADVDLPGRLAIERLVVRDGAGASLLRFCVPVTFQFRMVPPMLACAPPVKTPPKLAVTLPRAEKGTCGALGAGLINPEHTKPYVPWVV